MLSRGWGDAGGTDRAGQWLVGDGMMRLLTSAACDRAFAPLPRHLPPQTTTAAIRPRYLGLCLTIRYDTFTSAQKLTEANLVQLTEPKNRKVMG